MTSVAAGRNAPVFSLPDFKGRTHSVADALKKGPVVLAFFKVSCPVCQYALPFVERIHKAYGSEKVSIWGVSQDDARDTKEFGEEYGLTFPMLVDEEGYPVSNQYGLTNVPTVVMIAPDGRATVSVHGFSKRDLEKISADLAKHTGKPSAKVFLAGEQVPDYKPG